VASEEHWVFWPDQVSGEGQLSNLEGVYKVCWDADARMVELLGLIH